MPYDITRPQWVNALRLRRNEQHFADDIFKRIFLNENVWISIKISLKFVPKGPINNFPALVQTMAWHRSGDKPLSEPMMVSLPMHICITRPQWVKIMKYCSVISCTIIFRTLILGAFLLTYLKTAIVIYLNAIAIYLNLSLFCEFP